MSEKFDGLGLENITQKLTNRFGGSVTVADRKLGDGEKIDRRTLRKTGRTELFSARVTAETKAALKTYADANNMLLGEVLERALALLTKTR